MHIESVRYRLTQKQMTALLQLLELIPSGAILEPGPAVTDPRTVSGSAVDLDGRVPPVLATALTVLASPARLISLEINVPGSAEWLHSTIAAGAEGGPYVVVGFGDPMEILVLGTEIETAAVIDDALDLTIYPAQPSSPDIDLDLKTWIGLAAAADARRKLRLESQLARQAPPEFSFDAASLDEQLIAGLAGSDTSWAVTAVVPLTPSDLRAAALDGAGCAAALVSAELAEYRSADGRLVLTATGEHLADIAGQSLKMGGITLSYVDANTRAASVTVWRTPLALALTFWRHEQDGLRGVIIEPGAEAAVEMLRRLLLLPVSTPDSACPRCSTAVRPDHRFCPSCGASLEEVEVG